MTTRKTKPRRGAGRPPASDGDATRQRIMEAAQVCFAAHGYRETSNRMIAEEAGVTAGTIYHYFANKRDLFLSVHREIQKIIHDTVQVPAQQATTFVEALRIFVDRSHALYVEHPSFSKFNAVVRTEALRNPEIEGARYDQDWRRFYRELADLAVATGEVDEKNSGLVRRVLSMVVLGTTQHGIEAKPSDHAECLKGVVQLFEGTLLKPPRSG